MMRITDTEFSIPTFCGVTQSELFTLNDHNTYPGALYLALITTRMMCDLSTHKQSQRYSISNIPDTIQKITKYTEVNGYILISNKNSKDIFIIKKSASKEQYVLFVELEISSRSISINAYGDYVEVHNFCQWAGSIFETMGVLVGSAYLRGGSIDVSNSYLKKTKHNFAKDSFYPWMNVSLEDYVKAYMESNESILVLIGPPGTGKSTFLRSLIILSEQPSILSYSHDISSSPELLSKFENDDDYQMLIYEDADLYIGSRERGNTLMSSMLNAADGISSNQRKKFIFSTNLASIDKIDPALLRVGRCFDILNFELLTPRQAEAVITEMNLPTKDFSAKNEWTLGEVFHQDIPQRQTVNRFKKKVGF